MADELNQYVQCEIETCKFVVKGSLEVAQFLLRMIKALWENKTRPFDWSHDINLNKKGEKKTLKEIAELAQKTGGEPRGIDIRDVDLDEVLRIAEEKNLHWFRPVDFDPNDGLIPLQVPSNEYDTFNQIWKAVASKRLEKDTEMYQKADHEISELKEKIAHTEPGSNERKELETQLENVTQARDEAKQWVDFDQKVISTPDNEGGYGLQEFLYKYKDTELEKNPEKAMAELEKGVEIGKTMEMKDCLQPIRSKSFMPNSKVTFYVPEIGAVVSREFKVDEKTDLVYSNYALKKDNGEICHYTDHNMTTADWNKSVLPKIFQDGGILEGTKCRAFATEERLKAYLKYHNRIENPAKERIEEKLKKNEPVFSNAETKHQILTSFEESRKEIASAPVDENTAELIVREDQIINRGGKLDVQLSEGANLHLSNAKAQALPERPGMVKLTINEQSRPSLLQHGQEVQITARDAKRITDNVFANTSNVLSDTMKHASSRRR